MKLEHRPHNAYQSLYDLISSSLPDYQAAISLFTPVPIQIFTDDEQVNSVPAICIYKLVEDDFNELDLHAETLLQLNVITQDHLVSSILRTSVFKSLQLHGHGRAYKVGYLPFYDYFPDPSQRKYNSDLIVRPQGNQGWRQIKPGDDSQKLSDPGVVNYFSTIIIQF